MPLPFTIDQFLEVFREYNTAIWPAQLIAYAVGVIVVGLLLRGDSQVQRVWWAMAALWVWNGVVYHILHFSRINPAAYGFGLFFVLQGLLFALYASRRQSEEAGERPSRVRLTAAVIMVAYAMFGYPLAGLALAHQFPASPVFGVAPCPTVIYTFGILLWTRGRIPTFLLVIPALWALVGTSAAVALGMIEDFGLPVCALISFAILALPGGRPLRPAIPTA